MDTETGRVKLTDLASCGGCAAKYSAARLEQLLAGFVPVEAENLLVGLAPADDAAVYRLDDERALIFTLDFFPPVVDDPGDYGAIAATNALNDVFAMGGTPLLALSIAAFPEELPIEMLAEIFAAADAQVRAAGGLLAGGHTIRDAEPKYGLAVVGTVRPDGIWPKNGARPGDVLFLTKPLGTGLIMTGYKQGKAGDMQLERAIRWMRTLNKDAAEVLRPLEPNAVTDVTGFGLFGHAHEVADRSGVCIRLESERFPAIDGALDVARKGVRTSGDPRNRDFAGSARDHQRPLRHVRRARLRPADRRRPARLASGGAGRRARGGVRGAQALPSQDRPRGGGRRRFRRVSAGMIHGRFQPFHNGHLEYLRGAAAQSEEVFVGITNPDPQRIKEEPSDPLRHLPESNPFTYVERLLMIEAVAEDEGIRAHVIPFPVNEPELWPAYVPAGVTQYLRLFSEWGGTKLERMREAGYDVVVLDEGVDKEVSGIDVRAALRSGGEWEALVPPGVARVIRSLERVSA